jgi:hypothetical protein
VNQEAGEMREPAFPDVKLGDKFVIGYWALATDEVREIKVVTRATPQEFTLEPLGGGIGQKYWMESRQIIGTVGFGHDILRSATDKDIENFQKKLVDKQAKEEQSGRQERETADKISLLEAPLKYGPFAARTRASYDQENSDYEISFKNLTEAEARDIVEAVAVRLVVK